MYVFDVVDWEVMTSDLEVPQDAYAFGVFAADSATEVADVCERMGHPADRVSTAIDALDGQR